MYPERSNGSICVYHADVYPSVTKSRLSLWCCALRWNIGRSLHKMQCMPIFNICMIAMNERTERLRNWKGWEGSEEIEGHGDAEAFYVCVISLTCSRVDKPHVHLTVLECLAGLPL